MQINLSPGAAARVASLVDDENFFSAEEVVHFALEAFLAGEQDRAAKQSAFEEEIGRRINAADRGEAMSGEDFEAWLEERIVAHEQNLEHVPVPPVDTEHAGVNRLALFRDELGRRIEAADRGETIRSEEFERRMAEMTAPWRKIAV